MKTTEAWILRAGQPKTPGRFERCDITLPPLEPHQALIEPLWGSWEANMSHALTRSPIDVASKRREPFVVLGNCGVVRVAEVGGAVDTVAKGDMCLVLSKCDSEGFIDKVYGYDEPGTIGLLARHTVLGQSQLLKVPQPTRHSMCQWAAFGVRYLTAWSNWKAALGCWSALAEPDEGELPRVCSWGGGMGLAGLQLAAMFGCQTAMAGSTDRKLEMIRRAGIAPIDRRDFQDLHWDAERHASEPAYRDHYNANERRCVEAFGAVMRDGRADIFMDHLGEPVLRATLRLLARPGVLTTAGWKSGPDVTFSRPLECFRWHAHVHTHFANRHHLDDALAFAESRAWLPEISTEDIFEWDDVPALADAYDHGRCVGYFPLFAVNRQ